MSSADVQALPPRQLPPRQLPPRQLPPRQDWLFGRAVDLLIGCGLGYLLFIPVLLYVATTTGTTGWPPIAVTLIALLANAPHYGATVLRVYEAREDRRKYAVFSLYITIALALLLVASTRSIWLSSLLITVYVTWSPWHFAGQNYGLTLMFLRRRGIAVDLTTKRLIYGSFVLSAVLAIIAIHGGHDEIVFAPHTLHVANTPTIFYSPLPGAVAQIVLPVAILAYLGCLVGAGWRLRLRAPLRTFAPALVLVLTQALWFTVPAVAFDSDQERGSTLIFAAIWISAAHSLQYLWVTAYYARASQPGESVGRFLLKSFLAGTALVTIPAILLSPDVFGKIPWDAGLAVTLFSMVNIHHFILDGAIWKLRDGRVARVLLRAQDRPVLPEPIGAPRRRPWLRWLLWTIAGLAVVADVLGTSALIAVERVARSDRVESLVEVLRWTGREKVETHFRIGRRLAESGEQAAALEHLRRSIELFPTAKVWAELGIQYRAQGRWEEALGAFDAALALNPEFWGAHHRRAEALLAIDSSRSDPGAREQAIASLGRALELSPGFAEAALMLARLRVESGQTEEARRTLERALAEADPAEAASLRAQLAQLEESGARTSAPR